MAIEPIQLPLGWKRSTLGNIAKGFCSGGTPSTKNEKLWQGSIPWITSKWLNSKLYLDSGEKFISEEAVRQSATAVVPRGNLIFATRVGVGKVAINRLNLAINQDLAGILLDSEQYDSAFLAYQLRSERIQNTVASHKRGATIQGITRDSLKEIEVYLPPLPDQKKIALVLETVQRAIEEQERLLQLTTELKKSLLHRLFTEGLRCEPQKMTEIGLVPESWETVKIGSLGTVITGTTPKTKVPEYCLPPEVDFLAPGDLGQTRQIYNSERKISQCGLQVIRGLPKDAIMCVCIGSSIGKMGMTYKRESATNQQINSIICNKQHNPTFVYFLLLHFAEYWRNFATFGPVPILNKGSFEAINIMTPSTKDEELEIAQYLTAVDTKIEEYMCRKTLLTDLFRTLLHQLMTAQIRVHDLDLPDLKGTIEEEVRI